MNQPMSITPDDLAAATAFLAQHPRWGIEAMDDGQCPAWLAVTAPRNGGWSLLRSSPAELVVLDPEGYELGRHATPKDALGSIVREIAGV